MDVAEALAMFSPPVAGWFRTAYGTPTPPQAMGWPVIARGDNALILSPTGSGKTLTAFLWSLDVLFRELLETPEPERGARRASTSTGTSRTRPRAEGAEGVAGRVYVPGVRVVYVSPLKALNNDVERNLQVPLAGIQAQARREGAPLPAVRVGVRTGDTPASERQSMLRRPPHILITTPESLYLMLTAERARTIFGTTHTVIVDEIHTLVGTKRGAHLSLTLERLERLTTRPLQRIGLSATVRPLDTAARFLGGQFPISAGPDQDFPLGEASQGVRSAPADGKPRPVTVVDAGYKKPLDLKVITATDDFRNLPEGTIWSTIVPEVTRLIDAHRTTLIFCNSRRLAERTADRLNERRLLERTAQLAADSAGNTGPGGSGADRPGLAQAAPPTGIGPRRTRGGSSGATTAPGFRLPERRDLGIFAAGVDASKLEAAGLRPIRAHHGSMSKTARFEMEGALKAGVLPALVATSSLELGIDIGEIDLVVHLQSPKSVAAGLQRVGRSGHLVGQTSVGRIFTTHVEDVMEAATVAWGMRRGEIESTHTPENPLDILAQHVMAMVATEDWAYDDLLAVVRGAYPFRNLGEATFRSVLEMLSGKYSLQGTARPLQARLSWDRVNNRLAALPGSRLLAIRSGGTIPDRGTYTMVLGDHKTRVGELDEEFVFESRPGDTFLLGSQVWRIAEITEDRVVAEPAPGEIPRMPFWRGDFPWRPFDLGRRIGALRRRLADLLSALTPAEIAAIHDLSEPEIAALAAGGVDPAVDTPATLGSGHSLPRWGREGVGAAPIHNLFHLLHDECALDRNSILQVVDHVAGQLEATGHIATDRTVIVELYEDSLGDPRMVVHSPFGGRINGPWAVVLAGVIRERTGVEAQISTGDDGILLRFADAEIEPPVDVVSGLTSQEARERLLAELPNSAVFMAQFRMNAARALLLPREAGGKRTPLWLARLKAKDLLQAVQRFDDFPIVLETYRDCLRDVMDLDGLVEVLDQIRQGEIQVVVREAELPSPVARGLDYRFAMQYVYEYDQPRGERQLAALSLNRGLLAELLQDGSLAELLKPEAVAEVSARVSRTGPEARLRSAEELAQLLFDVGDLSDAEIAARCTPDAAAEWLQRLAAAGRVAAQEIGGERRWISAERRGDYVQLSADPASVLRRHLMHSGPTGVQQLAARYGLAETQVRNVLPVLADDVVVGEFTPGGGEQLLDRRTLEQMHRRTLALLRQEVQPVPLTAYADFLRRWQHVLGPLSQPSAPSLATRPDRSVDLNQVLQQLRGFAVHGVAWERDVLSARLDDFDPALLAERCQSGELMWVADGGRDPRRARVRFFFRGEGGLFLDRTPADETLAALGEPARAVYGFLKEEGAALLADIADGTELDGGALQEALVELALAGLVTNDTLAALHAVLGYEPPAGAGGGRGGGMRSSLEAQLAVLRPDQPRRMTRFGWRDARRRARETAFAKTQAPRSRFVGRWSLVHRPNLLGKALPDDELALRRTRQLLARWGIVTRLSLERETPLLRWEAIYPVLARLEMRGEVRRGYFVQGLPGLQFALPEVIEQLRAVNAEPSGDVPVVVLSAVDPAQLFGGALWQAAGVDGTDSTSGVATVRGSPLRFARVPSSAVASYRGEPVAAMEDGGASVTAVAEHPQLVAALRALASWWMARAEGAQASPIPLAVYRAGGAYHRLKVERWHGEPVLDSPGVTLLEAAGFVREGSAMLWTGNARDRLPA